MMDATAMIHTCRTTLYYIRLPYTNTSHYAYTIHHTSVDYDGDNYLRVYHKTMPIAPAMKADYIVGSIPSG